MCCDREQNASMSLLVSVRTLSPALGDAGHERSGTRSYLCLAHCFELILHSSSSYVVETKYTRPSPSSQGHDAQLLFISCPPQDGQLTSSCRPAYLLCQYSFPILQMLKVISWHRIRHHELRKQPPRPPFSTVHTRMMEARQNEGSEYRNKLRENGYLPSRLKYVLRPL